MGNYIKTHLGQSMPQAGKGLAIAVTGSGSLWSQGKLITSQIMNHLINSSHATSDGVSLYIPDAKAGKFAKILTLSGAKTYTSVAPVLDLTGGGYAVVGDNYYLIGIAGKSQKLGLTYNFKTDTWTSLDTEIEDYIGSAVIPKNDTDLYIYSGAVRNNVSNSPNILYKYEISSGTLTQVDKFEGRLHDSAFNPGVYSEEKLYIGAYKGIFIYDLSTKAVTLTNIGSGRNGTNYFVDGTTVYRGAAFNQELETSLIKWSLNPLEVTELIKTPKSGCAVLVKDSGWLYSVPFTDEDTNLVYLDMSQKSWQPVFNDTDKYSDALGPTVLEDTIVSKDAQVLKFTSEYTYAYNRESNYFELSASQSFATIQNHVHENNNFAETWEIALDENTTGESREVVITGIWNYEFSEERRFTQKIIQLPY